MCLDHQTPVKKRPRQLQETPQNKSGGMDQLAASEEKVLPTKSTVLGLTVMGKKLTEKDSLGDNTTIETNKILNEQYLVGWKIVRPDGNLLLSKIFSDFVWKPGKLLATGPGGQDGKGFYVMLKKPTMELIRNHGGTDARALRIHFKKENVVAAGEDQNPGIGYCVVADTILVHEKDYYDALSDQSTVTEYKRAVKHMSKTLGKKKKVAKSSKSDPVKVAKKTLAAKKKVVKKTPKKKDTPPDSVIS